VTVHIPSRALRIGAILLGVAILAALYFFVFASSDEDDVRDVTESFYAAVADGDEQDACELLVDDFASSPGELSCEDQLGFLLDSRESGDASEIEEIRFEGAEAFVEVTGYEGEAKLVKEGGEWRLADPALLPN
jgi:hypothetical protein